VSVAVVGSINRDIVARVPRIPRPGETLLAHGASRGGGGKGANQAVAAARAGGAPTAFVGAVGDDADGSDLRAALAADGIDVSGLRTAPDRTGIALISVDDAAENAIVVIPGANGAFDTLDDTQRRVIAAADVIVAQLEIPVAAVLAAAAARRPGAVFVLNGAPSAPLADPATGPLLLGAADVLVVNEHELQDAGGTGDASTDLERVASRVRALVVTYGADGSVVVVDGRRAEVPAFPADAVDTTGAGDTFCGVLAARLAGRPLTLEALAAAARAGAAAAALAVGRPGAQDAVPAAAEVDALAGGAA
jgi:ribokinase